MIRRTVVIAVPLLVLLALFAGGAPVVGAQESGDNPAVSPPTQLQDEYPLHDPAPGRSDPASPTARPDDLTRPGRSAGDAGRSPISWLVIALAVGLGVVLLARAVPLVVRRLSTRAVAWDHALARLRRAFADTLTRLRRAFSSIMSLSVSLRQRLQRFRSARARRTRHLVSPLAMRLTSPLFRYSPHRDAFILRIVGDRFGPVLRPRDWFRYTPHELGLANPGRSKAMGLAAQEHGLLFATDEQGKRWTLVGNAETVRAMAELAPGGELEGVGVNPAKFPMKREGWPDEWAELGSDSAPD